MRQYDIFENPSPKSRKAVPMLIVLQHDRAWETSSVVVAALVPLATAKSMAKSRLYPTISVGGRGDCVMLTPNLATIPRSVLGTVIANADDAHRRIIDAIDMLFTGV
jgi:toxin CcdB